MRYPLSQSLRVILTTVMAEEVTLFIHEVEEYGVIYEVVFILSTSEIILLDDKTTECLYLFRML